MHVINVSFAPQVVVDRQVSLLCEIERWMSVDTIKRHVSRQDLKAELYVHDRHFDSVLRELAGVPEVVLKLPDFSPLFLSAFKS